ncbi:hypothetical protein [Salinicoccus sp. HZC-1]|uniref:hypothetical protein n=1 Tax=Salinicoccus sp. HZC-1 TaxID=3385497 RepID=UPI00398A5948
MMIDDAMCHLMARMLKEPVTNLLVQFEYNESLNIMLEVILIADQLSKIFIDKNKNYSDARWRKIS